MEDYYDKKKAINNTCNFNICMLSSRMQHKNEASNQKQSTIEYETSVQSLSEQDIRQKEENDPMNISDLTQQSSQSVTIDYAIESNENIQNFSYSLLSQTLKR